MAAGDTPGVPVVAADCPGGGVHQYWLLLGAVFFGILLPIGLVLRGLGRLQYRTGFRSDLGTYRVEVPREHVTRLEEPF